MPRLGGLAVLAAIALVFGLFGQTIALGYLAVPISILWMVGVSNAFNIVDGLDGLSAGLALISSASLGAWRWWRGVTAWPRCPSC